MEVAWKFITFPSNSISFGRLQYIMLLYLACILYRLSTYIQLAILIQTFLPSLLDNIKYFSIKSLNKAWFLVSHFSFYVFPNRLQTNQKANWEMLKSKQTNHGTGLSEHLTAKTDI